MTRDDVRMTVFGAFDGLTSAVGVIFAAVLTSADVFAVALALAVSAAVSMAAGEWLADDQHAGKTRRSLTIGGATLVASALPAVAFAFGTGLVPTLVATVVTLAIAVTIAELRPGARAASYAKTFGVLTVASALACGASLLGQAIVGIS